MTLKTKFMIRETTNSYGTKFYEVLKRRKLFFWFGPWIWVNAGSLNDGYYGTDSFFSLDDAMEFLKELTTPPKVRYLRMSNLMHAASMAHLNEI